MNKTILIISLFLTALFSMSPMAVQAAIIYVDPVLGTDQADCGTVAGSGACATIQYAMDNEAGSGDKVSLAAGAYSENLVIDKPIILEGAGSGSDPGTNSIINSATASTNVIRFATGGTSATSRMILRNLRVTGSTGGPNYGNGINISDGSYITFDNVTSTGNEGNGITFNPGGDQTDIVVSGSTLSNNTGGTGFRVPTSASVDGLYISDSHMDGNDAIGLSMYGPVNDLNISDSTFNNNAYVGIYGKSTTLPPRKAPSSVTSRLTETSGA